MSRKPRPFNVDLLTFPNLDLAVLMAEGYTPASGQFWVAEGGDIVDSSKYNPSSDGHLCMRLMEKHWIGLDRPSRGQTPPMWRALADWKDEDKQRLFGSNAYCHITASARGTTAMVAVCRLVVRMKFGNEVEL